MESHTHDVDKLFADEKIPNELAEHIKFTSSKFFSAFLPVEAGVTSRAFFSKGVNCNVVPTRDVRRISVKLPSRLEKVYQRYPADVEFSVENWTFLSEQEIHRRHAWLHTVTHTCTMSLSPMRAWDMSTYSHTTAALAR